MVVSASEYAKVFCVGLTYVLSLIKDGHELIGRVGGRDIPRGHLLEKAGSIP